MEIWLKICQIELGFVFPYHQLQYFAIISLLEQKYFCWIWKKKIKKLKIFSLRESVMVASQQQFYYDKMRINFLFSKKGVCILFCILFAFLFFLYCSLDGIKQYWFGKTKRIKLYVVGIWINFVINVRGSGIIEKDAKKNWKEKGLLWRFKVKMLCV